MVLCVAAQEGDPASTLALTRRLTALRRTTPALQTGTQRLLDAPPGILAWLREGHDGDRWLSVVNFGDGPAVPALPPDAPARGAVVVGSDPHRPGSGDVSLEPDAVVDIADLTLAAGEAVLIRVAEAR